MKTKTINSNFDLTTTEGRIEALRDLNLKCKNEFKANGIEISDDALFNVNGHCIEISVKETNPKPGSERKSMFGSEINLYKYDEIGYPTSGSFDINNKASYWRTIHAASVLKNWAKSMELTKKWCNEYSELIEEITKLNEK